MNIDLNRFLCTYRSTLHPTTGESPSKLLLERNIRSRLNLFNPCAQDTVQQQGQRMTLSKHTGNDVRDFCTGQHVIVHDYGGKTPWIQSTVVGK